MSKREEFESGERCADVVILNWIYAWNIPEARIRAKHALSALKLGTAPCIDGMIYAYKMFLG